MSWTLDSETVDLLSRFVHYAVTLYIPGFIKASIGADASVNDLKLFHRLEKYKERDSQISEAALDTLRNHLNYLLPLFSDEKSNLAKKMFSLKGEFVEIKKLAGPHHSRVIQVFKILNLKSDWLGLPTNEWEDDEDYLAARKFVHTVKVINECAERGIKLAQDFAQIFTEDCNLRGQIFQVVKKDKRERPCSSKDLLNK